MPSGLTLMSIFLFKIIVNRAVSLLLGAVGMGISKRLEFSIDERISPPYLNSAPTYSAIILIAVIYLSACLMSLQLKMYPSRSEEFPLNFCVTVLLVWSHSVSNSTQEQRKSSSCKRTKHLNIRYFLSPTE